MISPPVAGYWLQDLATELIVMNDECTAFAPIIQAASKELLAGDITSSTSIACDFAKRCG